MPNTRNGYPVKENTKDLVRRPGPHTYVSEGGYRWFADDDVADILADAMWQWHTRIERVRIWGGWRSPSFNEKVNGNYASNHMSATATDTNWDDHPYERNFPKGGFDDGFTAAELRTLRSILALYKDDTGRTIVRSGMDYARGWIDAMHLEVGMYTLDHGSYLNVPRSKVRQVANKVRARHRPPRTFDEIKAYQRIVGVTPDGKHGPATTKAIRAYQKSRNVSQTGLWDEATKNAKEEDLMTDAQYNNLVKLVTDQSKRIANLEQDVKSLLKASANSSQPAPPEVIADAVWQHKEESHGAFNAWWWLRRGLVLNLEHPAFPADPGSPADLERLVAAKILGEDHPPYTGRN